MTSICFLEENEKSKKEDTQIKNKKPLHKYEYWYLDRKPTDIATEKKTIIFNVVIDINSKDIQVYSTRKNSSNYCT